MNRARSGEKKKKECGNASFFEKDAFFVFSALYLSRHQDYATARISLVRRTSAEPYGALYDAFGPRAAKRCGSSDSMLFTTGYCAAGVARSFHAEPFFRKISAQKEGIG